MIRTIVTAPHDILNVKAKPVGKFDAKIKALIRDMKETLESCTRPKGVGLAAPQIGVSLQVFIMKPTDTSPITVCVNPTIISKHEVVELSHPKKRDEIEGCLSIKKIWGTVHRAYALTLRYQDENGVQIEKEFTGFPATIVQHETDHLEGILFTQRVLEQKEAFYQSAKDAHGKEILEEIEM